jgi:hypothetical protein
VSWYIEISRAIENIEKQVEEVMNLKETRHIKLGLCINLERRTSSSIADHLLEETISESL